MKVQGIHRQRQPRHGSCRDNKYVWKVYVNENRVGLLSFILQE